MRKIRIYLVFILLFFSANSVFGSDCLKISFLDVGEGDAILITTPKGKSILIDTGNLITGFRVAEYLKMNNIKKLDYLIFTHSDPDHIGGSFFILQMLKVKNIYDNAEDLTYLAKSSDIYRWYGQLVRKSTNYRILRAKDALFIDGVVLNVLWPSQKLAFGDSNNNSIVIMLEFGKFRCLLTGDLGIDGERRILIEQGVKLKADILKVGHHGASDATCDNFLNKVSPKIAIISVNSGNIHGYPSQDTIDRLKQKRVILYRTDKQGDIILSIHQLRDNNFGVRKEGILIEG